VETASPEAGSPLRGLKCLYHKRIRARRRPEWGSNFMETKPSDAKRTRRRRSGGSGGSSGRGLTTANSYLQHPSVSRFAPIVMAAAAVLYVVASSGWIYHSATKTGGLPRGLSKIDTRYVLGSPAQEGANQWVYDRGGSVLSFNYNDRERADSILCYARGANRGACLPFLGVGVNTTEDVIWTMMGTPDAQKYYGDTKVIAYSGLGLQFTLERFAVKGIAFIPVTRPDLTILQAARLMLP
jgi:hypothetical protein